MGRFNLESQFKCFYSPISCLLSCIVLLTFASPLIPMQPKFIDVAKLWEQLRNQLYVLSEINVVNEQLMALTFSAPEWATICDAISQIAMATETTIANGNYLQISNNAVRDYPVQDPNAGQKTTVGLSQAAAIMAADVELMKIVKYHNGMKVSTEHRNE